MKNIFLILFVTVINSLFSQSIQDIRRVKYEAITLLEKYVTTCLFSTDINPDDEFYSICDEDAKIYNDILYFNEKQYVSPKDYFELFEKLKRNNGNFNLGKGGFELEDLRFPVKTTNGNWKIVAIIKKTFQITTPFRWKYPEWAFTYEIIIEMDNDFKKPRILSITPREPLNDFFIIKVDDEKISDENLKGLYSINDELVTLRYENSRIFDKSRFQVDDFTMKVDNDHYFNISRDTQDLRRYFFSLQPKKYILGFGINVCPYSFGKSMSEVNKQKFSGISSWSYAVEVNASLAYLLKSNGNSKTKWYLKGAINYTLDNILFKGHDYTEYKSIDADFDEYQRRIWLVKTKENVSFHSLGLPFGFFLNKTLQKKNNGHNLNFNFEIGGYAQYYFANFANVTTNSAYKGFYENLFNLEMDRYYDFGYFDINLNTSQVVPNSFDYGLYSGFGFTFNITKKWLLGIELLYKHGFSNRANYISEFTISENSNHYNSLIHSFDKIQTQNIVLNITFLTKF